MTNGCIFRHTELCTGWLEGGPYWSMLVYTSYLAYNRYQKQTEVEVNIKFLMLTTLLYVEELSALRRLVLTFFRKEIYSKPEHCVKERPIQ